MTHKPFHLPMSALNESPSLNPKTTLQGLMFRQILIQLNPHPQLILTDQSAD